MSNFLADTSMRLDRLLTTLALGSRKEAQQLIRSGRVSINQKTVKDPSTHVRVGDALELDRKPLDARIIRHVMLHKPCGVLTAARDKKQPTGAILYFCTIQ